MSLIYIRQTGLPVTTAFSHVRCWDSRSGSTVPVGQKDGSKYSELHFALPSQLWLSSCSISAYNCRITFLRICGQSRHWAVTCGGAYTSNFRSRQTILVPRSLQMNGKRRRRCVVTVVLHRQHAFCIAAVTSDERSRPKKRTNITSSTAAESRVAYVDLITNHIRDYSFCVP